MVSVICVAYNAEKYIVEAIDSVMNQSYKDLEVIVIDDGSQDGTIEKLKKYTGYPNFKLIKSSHIGNPGKLRNESIKLAKNNLIAFIDADDVWIYNKLEKQLRYVNDYEMVCSNAERIYENNIIFSPVVSNISHILFGVKKKPRIAKYCFTHLQGDIDLDLKELLEMNYVVTSSVLISREAIIEANYFEESLGSRGEDYILWLNVAKKNSIKFLNEALVKYRIHQDNLSLISFQERIDLLKRTIEIRSAYLNDNDEHIREYARNGVSMIYHEITKILIADKNFPEAFKYWKLFVRSYNNKFSLKYVKYLLLFCYLGLYGSNKINQ